MIIAILAGGKSQRMGENKLELRWHGRTLLEHAANQALSTGLRTIVVGATKPTDWKVIGTDFILDEMTGLGPISGLFSALKYSEREHILALAADMPLVNTEAISWLIDQSSNSEDVDGVCVRSSHGLEPLFSVYSSSLNQSVERYVKEGRRSLQGLIESANFCIVDAPSKIDRMLVNVNTPSEWISIQHTSQYEGE